MCDTVYLQLRISVERPGPPGPRPAAQSGVAERADASQLPYVSSGPVLVIPRNNICCASPQRQVVVRNMAVMPTNSARSLTQNDLLLLFNSKTSLCGGKPQSSEVEKSSSGFSIEASCDLRAARPGNGNIIVLDNTSTYKTSESQIQSRTKSIILSVGRKWPRKSES